MGDHFSGGGGAPAAAAGATAANPGHFDFGQAFSKILSDKYPLAGGLAHMVFGGGQAQPQANGPGMNAFAPAPAVTAPPLSDIQLQPGALQDYSGMGTQGAQLKSGNSGGLMSLIKLLA